MALTKTGEKLLKYGEELNSSTYYYYIYDWCRKKMENEWFTLCGDKAMEPEEREKLFDEFQKKLTGNNIQTTSAILSLVCEYVTDEFLNKLYNSLRKKRSLESKSYDQKTTTIAVKRETRQTISYVAKELGLTIDELLEGLIKGRSTKDIQKWLN